MTTASKVQVRIVRCPRCLVKLPELPGISLYKCGRCGTVIQAKNRARQIELESDTADGSVLQANEAGSSKPHVANVAEVESSMDKDNIGRQDERETELCEDISASEGTSSSPEFIYQGMCVDGPLKHKNNSQLLQDNGVDRREGGESDNLRQECDNLADQVKNLSENENRASTLPVDVNARLDASSENGGLEAASSAKQRAVVDNISDGLPLLRNLNLDNITNDGGISDSVVPPDSPMNESHVSLYLTSPDQENLDHSPRDDDASNFGRVESAYRFRSSPAADFCSEPISKHPSSVSNYQTAGSYYAYDGSESSYDGTDDHISEHISHPSRKSKDRYKVNDLQASSSHHAMKSRSSEIYTENKHKGESRPPFSSGDPLAGDRTGRYFSHQHGLLPPRRPCVSSPDKSSCLESEKLDLLRTVWELKDQLNRMHFSNFPKSRGFPNGIADENLIPFQNDHLIPEREIHPDRHAVSRHAFSGESVRCVAQANCPCLHCSPRDLHCSAQLPSQLLRCNNGHLAAHPDCSCGNFTSSASSQPYTSNNLWSGGSETKPDKQEKIRMLNLNRKHLLPIAGGAPFITCYHCSQLLQLPAEFLLFQKRCHNLKCNACKKTLGFSLLKGTNLVRYNPSTSVAPPSEADGYNSGEPIEDERAKLIRKKPRNKKESVKSVVPLPEKPDRRKPTSEIEELPASSSNSPLHHLMGYSSLSQVLQKM